MSFAVNVPAPITPPRFLRWRSLLFYVGAVASGVCLALALWACAISDVREGGQVVRWIDPQGPGPQVLMVVLLTAICVPAIAACSIAGYQTWVGRSGTAAGWTAFGTALLLGLVAWWWLLVALLPLAGTVVGLMVSRAAGTASPAATAPEAFSIPQPGHVEYGPLTRYRSEASNGS